MPICIRHWSLGCKVTKVPENRAILSDSRESDVVWKQLLPGYQDPREPESILAISCLFQRIPLLRSDSWAHFVFYFNLSERTQFTLGRARGLITWWLLDNHFSLLDMEVVPWPHIWLTSYNMLLGKPTEVCEKLHLRSNTLKKNKIPVPRYEIKYCLGC